MPLASFLQAVRALPENALARREWRGFVHQARDWRLWLGLRVPKDARGWGLPSVVWFCLVPYVVWISLSLAARIVPQYFTYPPQAGMPTIDILALCVGVLGLYVCLIAVALMAPSITREREKETWDTLRTTVASPHDILLGLTVGRLGPVLAAYLAVGLFWVVARPHYAPLLQPYSPFRLDPLQLALLVVQVSCATVAIGLVALAASARCRSTTLAVVVSVGVALLCGGTLVLSLASLQDLPGPAPTLAVTVATAVAAYVTAFRAL